jgi:hypothetical protein
MNFFIFWSQVIAKKPCFPWVCSCMINKAYLHIAHRILLSTHNIQSRFLAWYEQNEQWGMDINFALLRYGHCNSLRIPFRKRKWNLNMKNMFAEWCLIELNNKFASWIFNKSLQKKYSNIDQRFSCLCTIKSTDISWRLKA